MELDQHQPKTSREQEAADRAGAASLRSVQKRRDAGEKMNVGAQKCVIQRVRNSAGSAMSRWVEGARRKEVARMIEGHQHHDDAAHEVDGNDTGADAGGGYTAESFKAADRQNCPSEQIGGNAHDRFSSCRSRSKTLTRRTRRSAAAAKGRPNCRSVVSGWAARGAPPTRSRLA